ncbi:phage tail protein [Halalkalibacter sp. AB-rgal2]|uniref:phage tail protein n=1 Tax=Halalkalibacter sp. AB-rgal2 TaxID=3242695 RepID=UPI00359EA54C
MYKEDMDMSDQFIGEIRTFAGSFEPKGWAFCHGQLLSISQNEALFTLINNHYGGDGITNFALPDFRGKAIIHQGSNTQTGTSYQVGQNGGNEKVTLTLNQLPRHTHQIIASDEEGVEKSPANHYWASAGVKQYSNKRPDQVMDTKGMEQSGGLEAHDNMMPFFTLNYIIALEGLYPSRKN